MEREAKVRRAIEVTEALKSLVPELADAVMKTPYEHLVRLVAGAGPGGFYLNLFARGGDDMLEVQGVFDVGGENRGCGPTIKANATRGAEKVARDIARRLIPAYREALEEARAERAKADAFDDRRKANAARLGLKEVGKGRFDETFKLPGRAYLHNVEVYDDSMSVGIRDLPIDKAERIFAILREEA